MKVLQQFIFCSFFFSTYSLLAQPTEPCDVQMSYKNLDPGLVFDFVVIGSGPASGPIVRRLVDAGHRVILIEKGPYFLPPSPDASPIHNDSFDDTFQVKENANQWTVPSGLNISNHSIKQVDPRAYGIGANITIASRRREYPYRQVQGFGGQTLIYGGFAMRPSPGSFEKWPNITYEKMLPSFEKSELSSWACGSVSDASEAHSCGDFSGFLTVLLHNESAYPKIAGVIPQFCALDNGTLWLDTTGNKSLDYNGNYSTRAFCGSPQLFHNRTTNSTNHTIYPRDSLQDTYLPCDYLKAKKNNLTICVNSKVDRLILDANNQVTGAVLDGVGITVRGKRFILASGFRFSPQILMSSGIGDRANFSALGVETKVHLPDVGRYFHDEWGFTLAFKITNPNASIWTSNTLPINKDQMQLVKWATGAQGKNFTDVQLYLRLANHLPVDDYLPGFFALGVSGKEHDSFAVRVNLHQNDTFGETSGVFPVGTNGAYVNRFAFYATMFNDSEKSDRFFEGAISGYNKTMELVEMMRNESIQLQATNSTAALITAANQGVQPFIQALWDWGNLLALHGAGTCGIGRVVDSDLKVYNVSNLYIADMSVMPYPVDANPTATLYALGERLADHLIALSPQVLTPVPTSEPGGFSWSLKDTLIATPIGTAVAGLFIGAVPSILYRLKNGMWPWNFDLKSYDPKLAESWSKSNAPTADQSGDRLK